MQFADKLNFDKDENLSKLVIEAEELLSEDLDAYKEEEASRDEGKEKVEKILHQMKDFFA